MRGRPTLKPLWWALALGAACAPLVARLSDRLGLSESEYVLATLTCVTALALALRAPGTGALRSVLPAAVLGLTVPMVPIVLLGAFPPADGTYRSATAPAGRGVLVLEGSAGRLTFPEAPADADWVVARDWDGSLGAHTRPDDQGSYGFICMDCGIYTSPEFWISRDPFGPGIRVLDVGTGAVTRYAPSAALTRSLDSRPRVGPGCPVTSSGGSD